MKKYLLSIVFLGCAITTSAQDVRSTVIHDDGTVTFNYKDDRAKSVPIPNPQSPIPNPQSPNYFFKYILL